MGEVILPEMTRKRLEVCRIIQGIRNCVGRQRTAAIHLGFVEKCNQARSCLKWGSGKRKACECQSADASSASKEHTMVS